MALFFIVTLAVSVAAMILMLALKRYELASGRMVLAGARPGMSSFFQKTLQLVQHILPALAQQQVRRGWQFAVAQMQRAVAYSVVTFEHALEKVLRVVREHTGDVQTGGEPSAFLREVADYKKDLLYKKGLKKQTLKDPAPHDSVQEQ